MATTTNYSWDTPDDTDLVKDGALAIRDLGQDIDTSLYNITTGKNVGMVLLNTTSFSAVSSQNITTVFNADYENYRIVYRFTKSTSAAGFVRLLVGTTADSGADNYPYETFTAIGGTGTAAAANSSAFFVSDNDTQAQFGTIDLLQPFLTSETFCISSNFTGGFSTNASMRFLNGKNRASTSFDGFQVLTNGGTITGKVFTYGYND
jgi:hypothetical protein